MDVVSELVRCEVPWDTLNSNIFNDTKRGVVGLSATAELLVLGDTVYTARSRKKLYKCGALQSFKVIQSHRN